MRIKTSLLFAAMLSTVAAASAFADSASPPAGIQMMPPTDFVGQPCAGANSGLLFWDGVNPIRCMPNTSVDQSGDLWLGSQKMAPFSAVESGPKLHFSGASGTNMDDIYFQRWNLSGTQSQLALLLGENANSQTVVNSLLIGALDKNNGNTFVPRFVFSSAGDLEMEGATPHGEGPRFTLTNTAKTGSAAKWWSLYNMTGAYGDSFQIWRYPADSASDPNNCCHQSFIIYDTGDTILVPQSGNVGVGAIPKSKLDVGGEVKVGSTGAGCTANNAGAIRWTAGTRFEGCNGAAWTSLNGGAIDYGSCMSFGSCNTCTMSCPADMVMVEVTAAHSGLNGVKCCHLK